MKRSMIYLIYSRPHCPLASRNVLCPRSAKPARKKLAKEHWPSSTISMLDWYTPRTASVAHNSFLFALLSGGPTEEPTPPCWRFRCSGRWLIAASKSTFTLHQRWPLSLFVLCFTSYFLCLSVQKSVMHIWNWFETHCAVCWCCMEREVTKEVHQITASDEESGGLQWKNMSICNAVYINKEMWYMKILINRIQ